MSQTNNISDLNQQIADAVQNEGLVSAEIVKDMLADCNQSKSNLGQKLLQSHHISMGDFARLMKSVSSSRGGQGEQSGSATGGDGVKDGGILGDGTFGEYEILGEIARGGMGIVYRARQQGVKRIVALKILLTGPSADSVQIKRFFREAKATATLNHPNIIPIYNMGQEKGFHYFTMEFVDGGTFDDCMESTTMTMKDKIQKFILICDALDHAHAKGILHRDIKPSNVLIDKQLKPYITDFGLAKFVDSKSALTQTGSALGTPFYMSPEQVEGDKRKIDSRSDIYALGIILYQMLTKQLPFQAGNLSDLYEKICEDEPVPPSQINPETPKDLESICLKCIEKTREARYKTAGDLAKDLERYCRGEKVKTGNVLVKAKMRRYYRQYKMVILFVIGLLLPVLIFGGIYHFWQKAAESSRKFSDAQVDNICGKALKVADNGEVAKAITYLSKQTEKYKEYYQIHLLLGKLYQRDDRIFEANRSFKRAYKLAPQRPDVIFGVAEYYFKSFEFEKGLKFVDAYLKQEKSEEGIRLRGNILLKLGRKEEGEEEIAKANAIVNKELEGKIQEIQKIISDKPGAAMAELTTLLANYPSYDKGYFVRGKIHQLQQRSLEAIEDYSKAIELEPKLEYFTVRGKLFLEMNYQEEAMADLEKSTASFSPEEKKSLYPKLGKLAFSLRLYKKAYTFYEEILSWEKSGGIYLQMAKTAFAQENLDLCLVNLDRASELSPGEDIQADVLNYRGKVEKQRKQPKKAISLWQKALKKQSEITGELNLQLGLLFSEYNKHKSARKFLQEALKSYPDNAELYWALSKGFQKEKNYAEEEKALLKCAELEPWKTEYYFALGRMYSKVEELGKSEQNYLNCLHINPESLEPFVEIIERLISTGMANDSHKINLLFNNANRIVTSAAITNLFTRELEQVTTSSILDVRERYQPFQTPWTDELEKQGSTFIKGLVDSKMEALQQMAKFNLEKMFGHKELREKIRQRLKEKMPPDGRVRLQKVLDNMVLRLVESEKYLYRQLLVRYYSARDERALVQIYNNMPDSIDILKTMLENEKENVFVRFYAARVLYDLRSISASNVLDKLSRIGKLSTKVFIEIAQKRYRTKILKEGLLHPDPYVRSLCIQNLPKDKFELIEPLLDDKDLKVRLYAAEKLRGRINPKAVAILRETMENSDKYLRAFAVSAYWDISSVRVSLCRKVFDMPALGPMKSLDEYSPGSVKSHFSGNGCAFTYTEDKSLHPTSEILSKGEEWLIVDPARKRRYFLIREQDKIDVYLPTPQYNSIEKALIEEWSRLERILEDEEGIVRRVALTRALSFGEGISKDISLELMWDKDKLTRFQAVTTVAGRGFFRETLPLLEDTKVPLFFRVGIFLGGAQGMSRKKAGEILPFIFKAKDNPDPRVRMISLMSIAKGKSGRMAKMLYQYQEDEDYASRAGAGLGYMNAGSNRPDLIKRSMKLMRDPHELVRTVATLAASYIAMYHNLPELKKVHQAAQRGNKKSRKAATMGYMRYFEQYVSPEESLPGDDRRWDWRYIYANYIDSLVANLETWKGKKKISVGEEVLDRKKTVERFLQCFSLAIELDPKNAKYFFERGLIYYTDGQYTKALENIHRSIDLEPSMYIFQYWEALTLCRMSRYEDARKVVDEIVKKDPWNIKLLQLQIELYERLKLRKADFFKQRLRLVKRWKS